MVGREDVGVKHEIHVIGVCLIRLKDGFMITCGNRECGGSEVKMLSDYGCVLMLIGTMLAGQTRTMARRYQFVCAASWPLQIAIQNLFLLENISVVIPVKSGLVLLIWQQQ